MQLREQQREKTTFFDLPEEVLLGIFGLLGTAEDLCAVSMVCKVFSLVSSDDVLWKPLCSPDWTIHAGYVLACFCVASITLLFACFGCFALFLCVFVFCFLFCCYFVVN